MSVNHIELLEIRLPTFNNPLSDLLIITDVKLIRIVFSTFRKPGKDNMPRPEKAGEGEGREEKAGGGRERGERREITLQNR